MSVQWQGLDELSRLLRSLPADVQREAGKDVEAAARSHQAAASTEFPAPGRDVTGNLRRGTRLEQTGPLTWRTRNRQPHAHLYEDGFEHVSGRQVPGHDVYVPAAQTIRARMVQRMQDIVPRLATRTGVLSGR